MLRSLAQIEQSSCTADSGMTSLPPVDVRRIAEQCRLQASLLCSEVRLLTLIKSAGLAFAS